MEFVIAQTLAEATSALSFELPLESGDSRWTDFAKARGTKAVGKLIKKFNSQPQGSWLHVVFASHRGAGKTTELKRLTNEISKRYETVYFEANNELDGLKFEMEDLLLVIVRVVDQAMTDRKTPLPGNLLQHVEDWFAEVVFTDEESKDFLAGVKAEAKLDTTIPFFAKLMASITSSLQVESKHRETLKRILKKYPGSLLDQVNLLLDEANTILSKDNKEVLVVIDNLDRYEPSVMDELLVKSADRLKSLHSHLLLTPPISLLLRPESQCIEDVFTSFILPTIKLREPNSDYWVFSGPGKEGLESAIEKRISLDLMPDVKTRDLAISASGGAIRELLEILQDASLEADGEFITLEDMKEVLSYRKQRLRDRVDHNGWWETLRYIANHKRVGKEADFANVLFQRLAFQYNGDQWYDIHPLLADFPEITGST